MENVTNIAVAASALAGVFIAYRGLVTWRDQLRATTEHEVGRRLLRTVLRVRDAIGTVRNPLQSPQEIEEALRDAGHTDEEGREPGILHDSSEAAVYQARWRGVGKALSDLRVEELEAEVLWGRESQTLFNPLHECIRDLKIAVRRYLRHMSKRGPKLTEDQWFEVDRIIYDQSDDPEKDAFNRRINAAVEAIEDFIRPKLLVSRSGQVAATEELPP